jgi:hypothetical protein
LACQSADLCVCSNSEANKVSLIANQPFSSPRLRFFSLYLSAQDPPRHLQYRDMPNERVSSNTAALASRYSSGLEYWFDSTEAN